MNNTGPRTGPPRIEEALSKGPHTVPQIVKETGLEQSSVRYQLRKMIQAREVVLAGSERTGKRGPESVLYHWSGRT